MSDISDRDESDLWTSPAQKTPSEPRPKIPKTPKTPKTPTGEPEPIDRDTILRNELEGVKNVNEAMEGLIGTLERAGGNMGVSDGHGPTSP